MVELSYLRGMHLNDCKPRLGSRVERHASLGQLGWEPFRYITNDPHFVENPLLLQTRDPSVWARAIRQLYALADTGPSASASPSLDWAEFRPHCIRFIRRRPA